MSEVETAADSPLTMEEALAPSSTDVRAEVAATCTTRYALRIPVVVDNLDDEIARAYGGWPDRLYLIGRDGDIAYQGGEGPFGFKPDELGAAIERALATS